MSNNVTIYNCRTCEGTGLEKLYYQIPQCAGCGHAPLDLSASTCPRCHRSKYQTGFLHAQRYNTRKCTVCYGFKQMLLIKSTTPGMLFGHNTSFRNIVASEINLAKYAPHLALGSTINVNPQTNTNSQLLTTIANYIANSPKSEQEYYYFDGKDKYLGTVKQIVSAIKKNPTGTHQIYFNGEWRHARELSPFSDHIPKKSRKKSTLPTTRKSKSAGTPKTSKQNKKNNPKKQMKPKRPPLTYPHKESRLRPLFLALKSIRQYFHSLDWPGHTKRVGDKIKSLLEEWENGIDTTKKSQPTMNRVISEIYSLPDNYLELILDHLETIELNKHLVSKQKKTDYTPPPKPVLTYPKGDNALCNLYTAFSQIHEQFRAQFWPGNTYSLGFKIEVLLEDWDTGINTSEPSHPSMNMVINALYALNDKLLIDILDKLECIEQYKHLICNQKQQISTTKQQCTATSRRPTKSGRERFSVHLLYEEIMTDKTGWFLEIPTEVLKTSKRGWNESRIGVVAKVLREHDSRISFDLFLRWCQKYGTHSELMVPILSNKKTVEQIFEKIWGSGQFNDKEFQGNLILKGSTDNITLYPK